MGETRPLSYLVVQLPPRIQADRLLMPSERRKAKRVDARRVHAMKGAASAAAAGETAAARSNVIVNPGGDWTWQSEDPEEGHGGYCPPRHRTSCNLRHEG